MSEGEFGAFHTSEGEPINFRPQRQGSGGKDKWGTHRIGTNEKGKPRVIKYLKEVVPLVSARIEAGSVENLSHDQDPEQLLIQKQEGGDNGDGEELLSVGGSGDNGGKIRFMGGDGQGSVEQVGSRKAVLLGNKLSGVRRVNRRDEIRGVGRKPK